MGGKKNEKQKVASPPSRVKNDRITAGQGLVCQWVEDPKLSLHTATLDSHHATFSELLDRGSCAAAGTTKYLKHHKEETETAAGRSELVLYWVDRDYGRPRSVFLNL